MDIQSGNGMNGVFNMNFPSGAGPEGQSTRTKRHFSYEEDMQIRQLVQVHGTNQWGLIASNLNGRTPRQVRDRWRGYLSPSVIKAEWTTEEEMKLIQLKMKVGKVWSQLVKFFPGRTDTDLKNHWNKLQRHAKKMNMGNGALETPANLGGMGENNDQHAETQEQGM